MDEILGRPSLDNADETTSVSLGIRNSRSQNNSRFNKREI